MVRRQEDNWRGETTHRLKSNCVICDILAVPPFLGQKEMRLIGSPLVFQRQ